MSTLAYHVTMDDGLELASVSCAGPTYCGDKNTTAGEWTALAAGTYTITATATASAHTATKSRSVDGDDSQYVNLHLS